MKYIVSVFIFRFNLFGIQFDNPFLWKLCDFVKWLLCST